MIDLRMLGQIDLRGADGTEMFALLRQPKRVALLAYLASPAPGTWHRRDFLLALFWPELDTAHARTSLRNGIYNLRQSLGESVIRNRGDEEISIDPDSLRTDLAEVLSALKAGDVERALANYGGELLSGLYPQDSEGFQRWVESERTRLRVAISTSAMAHVDALEASGNPQHALVVARKVSEINPDDETIVRRVMTLHDKVGDRAGGLTVFESYRSRLQKDFDADPARETIEIANRLRSSTAAFHAASAVTPSSSRTRDAMPAVGVHGGAAVNPQGAAHSRRSISIVVPIAIAVLAVAGVVSWRVIRSSSLQTIGRSAPLTRQEGLQVQPSISTNGRLVAYAKGTSNHLKIYVQRINGGDPWLLTNDDSPLDEQMPRWSPENDEVLFLRGNNAYAASYLGGKWRLIVRGSSGDGMIRSAVWSPAGDSIAIVRNDSLMVIPGQGGSTRYVGKGFQLHSCAWSPDSRWIACVSGNWIAFTPGPLFGNDAPSVILLFPASGGNPVQLTEKDYESKSPSWSADGRFLWMVSNRGGTSGEAYAVEIGRDGHARGKFIRAGVATDFISISKDRIAYTDPSKKANLWSLPISRDSVVSLASATRLTSENQVIELVAVSSDGKSIAYDSDLSGNADIYRMPIAGGPAERLTKDSRQEFAPDFSPDGKEITWQRWIGGVRHLFVKKIDSDIDEEILPEPGDQGTPRWSPDGRSIAAWSHNNERGAIFVVKRGSDGKWRRPAWRLDYGQLPRWSPDGRTLAFVLLDGSVRSIPADSGAVTTLYAPRPNSSDPLATYLVWNSPNSIWMLANSGISQGIWELTLSTGKLRRVFALDDPIGKVVGPALAATRDHFYFALKEPTSNIRWAELSH